MKTESQSKPRGRRRAKNLTRWLAWTMLAAGLVALVAFAAWPTPVAVEVAKVVRGPLVLTVDEAGRARVRDRYVVSAPLAGDLARIELRAGDAIAPGAPLARIVPAASPLLDTRSRDEASARAGSASAALAAAKLAVERSELASKHADDELAKARTLVASGAATGESLDHAELEARLRASELVSARFSSQMAAFELQLANAILVRGERARPTDERFEIGAPASGRVLRVLQESAGVVAPGTPLLEIGDPTHLEVVVDVLSADAARIHAGATATLEAWGGAPLAARVRLVEPSAFTRISALGVEEQRVHLVLDLLEPRDRWTSLGDGYRVEARIVVAERPSALLVPAGAVFRRGEAWALFVLGGGRARLRTVRTGERNARFVEIVDGVVEGDQVVVHPSERVEEGVRARAR